MASRVNNYFVNNSDIENDVLVANIIKTDNATITEFIDFVPTIELKEEFKNSNEFNDFMDGFRAENLPKEDDYDKANYFNDIEEIKSYYQKHKIKI